MALCGSKEPKKKPLLDREEERELARLAEKGDTAATERLIISHLGFVVNVAKGYRRSGVPMSDLVQEGVIGLVKAVKKFNPEMDARLATYAKWWIRASIQDHIVRSWSIVRLSTTSAQKSLFLNLRRKTAELIDGADALSDTFVLQLAERFETTAADVKNLARRVTQRDQSLDTSPCDHSSISWLDLLRTDAQSPEDQLAEESENYAISELIKLALDSLPDRERFIIRNRYFTEAKQTFASIGKELNLSKDRVRQLEACALASLRKILEPGLAEHQILFK